MHALFTHHSAIRTSILIDTATMLSSSTTGLSRLLWPICLISNKMANLLTCLSWARMNLQSKRRLTDNHAFATPSAAKHKDLKKFLAMPRIHDHKMQFAHMHLIIDRENKFACRISSFTPVPVSVYATCKTNILFKRFLLLRNFLLHVF